MKFRRKKSEEYQKLVREYVLKNRNGYKKFKALSLKEIYSIAAFSCIIIHLLYVLIFFSVGMHLLTIYNIGSVLFYIIIFLKIKKEDTFSTLGLMHIEVVFYSVLACLCLGLNSGFSYLLLCFLGTLSIGTFKRKYTKYAVALIEIIIFFMLRWYCVSHEPFYSDLIHLSFIRFLFIFNMLVYFFEVVASSLLNDKTNLWLQEILIKQNIALNELASIDQLTKLMNRRSMVELLEKEQIAALLHNHVYTVVISDIDNFKSVNDTYGHQCGDYVLSTIASIITKNMDSGDGASRWGGEEFLFVFPNTTTGMAVEKIERIKSAIEKERFAYDNYKLKVTMTFGVCNSKNYQNVDKIIAEADKLLYIGKVSGKNCVKFKK